MRIDEDIEMETLVMFVVPVLPVQGSARSAAQGVASNQMQLMGCCKSHFSCFCLHVDHANT